jgi:transketolase
MPSENIADIEKLAINTIRSLSIDAIEKANPVIQAHPWDGAGSIPALDPFHEAQPEKP